MNRLMGCRGSHQRIENDGFKICHSGQLVNHETQINCQKWYNTTSNDKVERIGLWDARRRMLELLWKESRRTLWEGIKSLLNHHVEPPWRTLVTKGWSNGRKEKLKTQGDAFAMI